MRIHACCAVLIWLSCAGDAIAGSPADVLPQGIFATGSGCNVLAKSFVEDLETVDFTMFSSEQLFSTTFACNLVDAEAIGGEPGSRQWSVKADCYQDLPPGDGPGVISVGEAGEGQLKVSIVRQGGQPEDLGVFKLCRKALVH